VELLGGRFTTHRCSTDRFALSEFIRPTTVGHTSKTHGNRHAHCLAAQQPSRGAGTVALAKEYYAVSRNLIPTEKERYEPGHIQALLPDPGEAVAIERGVLA
jgi:hypothetical protein